MRGVDHDPLRFAALARQFGENLVEHAQAAPSNKPIVDRLVRAIVARSVAPTQPVLDHKDDRADDPPIVHPRNPMRKWKIPFNPTHLNPRQQKQISHGEASQPPPMNQPIRTRARTLIGPEPRNLGIDPPVSCRRTHFARRGEELWQTDDIVGGYGEDEGGADLVEAAHFHLREAGDRLAPTEAFLDALAQPLA